MINQAPESLNIEQKKLWTPQKSTEYIPQTPKTPEKQKDTTNIEDTEKKLETAYNTTSSTPTTKEDNNTSTTTQPFKNISPEVKEAIKNRSTDPNVQQGITTAYQDGKNAFEDMIGRIKWLFGWSSKKE